MCNLANRLKSFLKNILKFKLKTINEQYNNILQWINKENGTDCTGILIMQHGYEYNEYLFDILVEHTF